MEKDYLIENLSLLIASGTDLISALVSIKGEVRSKKAKKTIDELINYIKEGSTLWQAFEKTKLLPDYVISLVKIGEESGKLPENLKIVVINQQKQQALKSKIQSALFYPVFVLSLTLIIGLGIAWFILPKLALVFSSLRLKLPLITQILISIGLFLGKYGIIVVPLIVLLLIATVYLIFINKKSKFIGENILFNLPIFRSLIQSVEISRMGFLLGTLLSAGIPITEAFSSLAQATTSSLYQKLYVHMQQKVTEGNSVEASLKLFKNVHNLIPAPTQQIILSAEQSGKLPDVLLNIGENYDGRTENLTKNLTVMLEPFLLIIVWLGVLFVAIGVILPIYSLIGELNR